MQNLFEDSTFQFFGDPETYREIQNISFGWKIHIASDATIFMEIFSILKTQLENFPIVFKIFRQHEKLETLQGTIQEGKAFTLYFLQDEATIRNKIKPLMNQLAQSLSSVEKPTAKILEEPYPNSPFLYYRYGDYNSYQTILFQFSHSSGMTLFFSRDEKAWILDRLGRKWLIGPPRMIWMDRQSLLYKPKWISDPFKESSPKLSVDEALSSAGQSQH